MNLKTILILAMLFLIPAYTLQAVQGKEGYPPDYLEYVTMSADCKYSLCGGMRLVMNYQMLPTRVKEEYKEFGNKVEYIYCGVCYQYTYLLGPDFVH